MHLRRVCRRNEAFDRDRFLEKRAAGIARERNIGAEALKNENEYPVDKRVSRARVYNRKNVC